MPATAAGLLGHAVRLGLVEVRDVLDGRATVHEQSRSNVVHRITLDGRAVAFTKEPGPAHLVDGVDNVTHERTVLQHLDGLRGVPRLLPAPAGQLWTAPVPGAPVAELDLTTTPVARVATAWGAALAAVHTAPVTGPAVLAPRPWLLDPYALPAWMDAAAGREGPAAVVAELRTGRALGAAVAHTARTWRPVTWVHGDPGMHNVLLAGAAAFIDFEDAGLGDASWDLACALASLELLVTSWGLPPATGAAEFIAAYAGHGGPGHPHPMRRALATALLAWQVAAADHGGDSGALLRRAVAQAADVDAVGAR